MATQTQLKLAQQFDDAVTIACRHYMRGDMKMFAGWIKLAILIRKWISCN